MTDLEAIRKRDAEGARPFAHYDRRDLLEEVDRLNKALETEKKIREAFEGACADLAKSGIAERDALRNAVILLHEDNERIRKELGEERDQLTKAREKLIAALQKIAAVESLQPVNIELWSGRSEDVVAWVDLREALNQDNE